MSHQNEVTSLQHNNDTVIRFEDIKRQKLKLSHIKKKAEGITKKHAEIIKDYDEGHFMILNGCAGTGKTFILLNKAFQTVLDSNEYRQIVIVRSIVPVRDVGYLKGNKEEKCQEYETPYIQICNETFNYNGGSEMYEKLKKDGILKFEPTSFNQGITFHDTIIIVDEAQNMNYDELYNITTRVGENSKIYFAGDFKKQNMLKKNNKDKSGLKHLIDVVESSPNLNSIFKVKTMSDKDIVRSSFVKEFVKADYNYVEEEDKTNKK